MKPYRTVISGNKFSDILEINAVKKTYKVIVSDTLVVNYEDKTQEYVWNFLGHITDIPIPQWMSGINIKPKKVLSFILIEAVVKAGWENPEFVFRDSADCIIVNMPVAQLNDVYTTKMIDVNEQVFCDGIIDSSLISQLVHSQIEPKQSQNFDSKHLSSEFLINIQKKALENVREIASVDTTGLLAKANLNLANYFGDFYFKANQHIDHIIWKDSNGEVFGIIDRRGSDNE